MDVNFWHDRWKTKNISFHQKEVNSVLQEYFDMLKLPENARVFIPLCGKTLDISWFLTNHYRVAGVELSEIAVVELFEELDLTPEVKTIDDLQIYSAENIHIFVGNIFDLTAETLGKIDAVYDRAALVALPLDIRVRYAEHLSQITNQAQQLLLSFEYDQTMRNGPPFSVTKKEIESHYNDIFEIDILADTSEAYDLKEVVFHLRPRR